MVNSAVQAVLNTTDTWFMGRVSPAATAAISAVYWPVLVFGLLFGGVGLAVQTLVAQAYGARRYARASQATWTALWASLFTVPLFAVLAVSGPRIFGPFGIAPATLQLALSFWQPRMLGGPLGVAMWAVLGFFNGIGRPTITLRIALGVAAINALLNQVFMFNLGMGVPGSAWATNTAQLLGVAAALIWFLGPATRQRFRSHLTTRLHARALWHQVKLGFPMGLLIAADILGFALFQLMQVRLGTVDGASSQIVMMLTSFCYMPAVGIAMAGTTLVGQAIGAGHRDWAFKVGNGIVLMATLYMGAIGILLAAAGPWVLPLFTNGADPDAATGDCARLHACYGLPPVINCSMDSTSAAAPVCAAPAMCGCPQSWSWRCPGWCSCRSPTACRSRRARAGSIGCRNSAWVRSAAGLRRVIYIFCLGMMLFLRWYSCAWQRIALPLN